MGIAHVKFLDRGEVRYMISAHGVARELGEESPQAGTKSQELKMEVLHR